jgi:hypothetical protein
MANEWWRPDWLEKVAPSSDAKKYVLLEQQQAKQPTIDGEDWLAPYREEERRRKAESTIDQPSTQAISSDTPSDQWLAPYKEEEKRRRTEEAKRFEIPTQQPVEQPPESSGFLRQAADIPTNIGLGITSGLKNLTDLLGAENPLSQSLAGNEKFYSALLSAEAKQDQQTIAEIMKEAEGKGILPQIAAGVQAAAVAPVDLLSNALGSMAPIIVGGLAGRFAGVARAAQLGLKAEQAASVVAGGIKTGQLVTGMGMGAGNIKSQIYDSVKTAMVDSGKTEEEAQKIATDAQAYNGKNLPQILLGAGLGALDAWTGSERIIGKVMAKSGLAPEASRIASVIKSGFTEAVPEAAQAAQERIAANTALQNEGVNVDLTKGVFSQAAMEGLIGMGMGGVTAAIEPRVEPTEDQKKAAASDTKDIARESQSVTPATSSLVEAQANTILSTPREQPNADLQTQLDQLLKQEKAIKDLAAGVIPTEKTPTTTPAQDPLARIEERQGKPVEPAPVAQGTRIEAAAFMAPDNTVYYGKDHLEAMGKALEAGKITQEEIDAKQEPASRETKEFGFSTEADPFIGRSQAEVVATGSGQMLVEKPASGLLHSNEVAQDAFPQQKVEAEQPPVAEPVNGIQPTTATVPTTEQQVPAQPAVAPEARPVVATETLNQRGKQANKILINAGVDPETAAYVAQQYQDEAGEMGAEEWRSFVFAKFEENGGVIPAQMRYSEDPEYYQLAFNSSPQETATMLENAKAENARMAQSELEQNKQWRRKDGKQTTKAEQGIAPVKPEAQGAVVATGEKPPSPAITAGGIPVAAAVKAAVTPPVATTVAPSPTTAEVNAIVAKAQKERAANTLQTGILSLKPKFTIGKTVRAALKFASRLNFSRTTEKQSKMQDIAAILAKSGFPALDNEDIVSLASRNRRGRAIRFFEGDIGVPSTKSITLNTLVHESAHSITADQIRKYAPRGIGDGKAYIDSIRGAIADKATPEPVARLFSLYVSTLEQLGVMEQYGGVGGIAGTTKADTSRNKARELQRNGKLRTDLDSDALYALANVQEFVSQTFSATTFRDLLKTLKAPDGKRSMWSAFVDAIKQILGLPDGTMAAAVIEASYDIGMEVAGNRQNRVARQSGDQAQQAQAAIKLDADYLAAVERGDMETAQKMVDAEQLGVDLPIPLNLPKYSSEAYKAHWAKYTGSETSKASPEQVSAMNSVPFALGEDYGLPIFLNSGPRDKPNNTIYEDGGSLHRRFTIGDSVVSVMIGKDNSIHFSVDGSLGASTGIGAFRTMNALIPHLKQILRIHARKNPSVEYSFYGNNPRKLALFDRYVKRAGLEKVGQNGFRVSNEEAKSADPVTYDEQGNIIPLSERFNPEETNIDYAPMPEVDLEAYQPKTPEEQKAFDKASSNKVMARNPELAVAAVRMKNGEITAGEYADLVDALDPFVVKGVDAIPEISKIKQYIDKAKVTLVGNLIKAGKLVEFRIDIPTYNRSTASGDTVYAVTAHEPVGENARQVGKAISYVGVAKVTNPTFMTRAISGKGSAAEIAMGSGKFPLATVKGNYEPITQLPPDINDPNVWTEVGYNPVRSSAFVDTRSKQAVVGGSEAIMVGSRVFVKDAVMQSRPRGVTYGADYAPQPDIVRQETEAERNTIDAMGEVLQNADSYSYSIKGKKDIMPMEDIIGDWFETTGGVNDLRDSIVLNTHLDFTAASTFADAIFNQYNIQKALIDLRQEVEARKVSQPSGETRPYSFVETAAAEIPKGDKSKIQKVYDVLSNNVSSSEATEALNALTLDEAISAVKDMANGIKSGVRTMMAQITYKRLMEERQKISQEQGNRSQDYVDIREKHIDLFDWISDYAKDLGQGVQAFARFADLGPDGILRHYEKTLKKIVKTATQKYTKTINKLQKAISDGDMASFNEALTRNKQGISNMAEKMGKVEAKAMTIEEEGQKIAQRVARTIMRDKPVKQTSPLSDLVNSHIRNYDPDFATKAQAMGVKQENIATIEAAAVKVRDQRAAAKSERERFTANQQAFRSASIALARENKYLYGERPTIWENYQTMFSERFAKALMRDSSKKPPASLMVFTNRLTQNLIGFIPETERATSTPQSIQSFIEDALNNKEKYQQAFAQAKRDISMKVADLEEKASTTEAATDAYLEAVAAKEFMDELAPQIKDFPVSPKTIDRFVNQRAKQLEISLTEEFNSWYKASKQGRVDIEQSIKNRLLQGRTGVTNEMDVMPLNIPEADVAKLARYIVSDFKQKAEERRKKALQRFKTPKKTVEGEVEAQTKLEKLLELINMGVITDEEAYGIIADKYKLPQYSKRFADELYRAAEELQGMPDQLRKKLKTRDLMAMITKEKGFSASELGTGFIYANMLSSPDTHIVNIIDTLINNFANGIVDVIATGDTARLQGILKGYKKGWVQAIDTFKTGLRIGMPGFEAQDLQVLETNQFGVKGGVHMSEFGVANQITKAILESKPAGILNYAKYVGRLLEAQDAANFAASQEGQRYAEAAFRVDQAAKIAGTSLTKKERKINISVMLNSSDDALIKARQQAIVEGYTGTDAEYRAIEITEENISPEIKDKGFERALKDVYRQKPMGTAGALADTFFNFINQRVESPLARSAIKLIVSPFVVTPVNIFNKWLDWSPYGFKRAFYGSGNWMSEKYKVEAYEKGSIERRVQMLKASSSVLVMGVVAALVQAGAIALTGRGPNDEEERKDWLARGNKPYRVNVGGVDFNFTLTPWAIPLSLMANYMNWKKYNMGSDAGAMERLVVATMMVPSITMELPFMSGVADLFDLLNPRSSASAEKRFEKFVGGKVGMFYPNAFRYIDRLFDPAVYKSNGIRAMFIDQTPFVRRSGGKLLNLFGDQIGEGKSMIERFSGRVVSFPKPSKESLLLEKFDAYPYIESPNKESVVTRDKDGAPVKIQMTQEQYEKFAVGVGQQFKQYILSNYDMNKEYSEKEKEYIKKNILKTYGDLRKTWRRKIGSQE